MPIKRVWLGVVGLGVLSALAVSTVALGHKNAPGNEQMTLGPAADAALSNSAGASTAGLARAQVTSKPETSGQSTDDDMYGPSSGHLQVTLRDVRGNRIAQVDIYPLQHGGNRVSIHAWNLTAGFHGIHIHAVGVCDPAGAKPFASAGGHFNPTGSPEGMQAGAFPVLLAGANGQAVTEFLDASFKVRDLSGPTGTAIVIHALADNYANIPPRYTAGGVPGPDAETQMTGDGGGRVACGVVAKPKVSPTPTPTASRMAPMPGMN